jgi:4-hydroxybenzoate polyprenyltransferase
MKKTFRNFLLLTTIISVIGTLALATVEYLFGVVGLVYGAVITVTLGFIYSIYMQMKSFYKSSFKTVLLSGVAICSLFFICFIFFSSCSSVKYSAMSTAPMSIDIDKNMNK